MKISNNISRLAISTFMLCLFAFSSMSNTVSANLKTMTDMPDSCPTASFTIANNGALAGTAIIFVNQSSGATSYHWDFGDGNFSCAANPSHVYASAGTYTVILKAIAPNGCASTFIGTEDVVIE